MKKADTSDPFAMLAQVATSDKRFQAQVAGVSALSAKGDWRGVTLGCKVLYRMAEQGGFLDKVEPILRPIFDSAVAKFEQSRAAMVSKLQTRLVDVYTKLGHFNRLEALLSRAL